jgi:biopolymer transport protein ExbD
MVGAGLIWLALLGLDLPGQEQKVLPGEPFPLRLFHEGKCAPADAGKICPDDRHWKVDAGGRALDFDDLDEVLKGEAERERKGAPHAQLSERSVEIGGEPRTPWARVITVMRRSAAAGIYKIALRGSGAGRSLKFWLREPERKPVGFRLQELTAILSYDRIRGRTVRRVGARGEVESLDELIAGLKDVRAELRRGGKTDFPVILDVGLDVPWEDVFALMERLRSAGFETLEFVPDLRRLGDPDK